MFLYLQDLQFLLEQRLRKVVPVMYKRCQLPPELTYYFWLDYSRAGKLYDFWMKLHNSIHSPSSVQPARYFKYWKYNNQSFHMHFLQYNLYVNFLQI